MEVQCEKGYNGISLLKAEHTKCDPLFGKLFQLLTDSVTS